MYCMECGSDIAPDATFCVKCGTSQPVAVPAASPPPKAIQYRVILKGIKPDFDPDEAKSNLLTLFKVPSEKIEELLLLPQFVVKKGLPLRTAEKYQAAIEMAGGQCLVELDAEPPALTADKAPARIAQTIVDSTTIVDTSDVGKQNAPKNEKGWFYVILIVVVASGIAYWWANIMDSNEVKQVKGGVMQICPSHTVNQMVKGFMGSPSWTSGKSADGKVFVNVEGDITFQDKPVRAMVQFFVNGDNFSFNAFEMNGVPSANIIAIGLMNKMCESAEGSIPK